MKQESLEWLCTRNPWHTKRFATLVGRKCRETTIKAVAEELRLDWKTVKELDKDYMKRQLEKHGTPAPEAIGIDEIATHKGHSYKIIVSDLKRKRAIWFGGKDRTEKSMDMFYEWLGEKKSRKIKTVVMDMWKPFRSSAQKYVPEAEIIYDKFHIIRHLQEAVDKVRKQEYKKLASKEKSYIKGTKYVLLTRKKNLTTKGKQALKELFAANQILQQAYLLKETFDQLWEYRKEGWARRFFDNWKDALVGEEMEPLRKFAVLVESHWDGIMAYCRLEDKVALGYVEGLNNKVRVLQRRAYGLNDDEYLRLKVLTCSLPKL